MRLWPCLLIATAACAKPPALDADGCPKDLTAAQGVSCSDPGKTCGGNPSGYTHLLVCSDGKWVEMEAPPPPPPKAHPR